jgi:membrane protease YdiL (CAAX protease family)
VTKLTIWINRNQLVSFYILTFVITWGLGFTYGGVLLRGQLYLFPLAAIATCGPALAGIIITTITNTKPRHGPKTAFWYTLFTAWILSTIVFLTHNMLFNNIPFSLEAIVFSLVSTIPTAFVIGMSQSRIPAVKSYLKSLIQLRPVWTWVVIGLVLFPGLIVLAVVISHLLGRQNTVNLQFPVRDLTLIYLVPVKFLYQLLFFNATGEETGWRGFALPRLQARTSPLITAIIITLFWVPWHFFLWQAEGAPVLSWQYWLIRYMIMILTSVIIVWITNRAYGSILVAGISHAAMNTAEAFITISDGLTGYLVILVSAVVLILADRMWDKLPPDHPAVYKTLITGTQ